ncbi:hypothetical protein OSSY52_12960 [Tepiditoga spiralis]|uniref:Uncharacterized protein n=1 Tax=Tepiditoga spiralis TaxID=2108365 RepID=A0A7G1G4X5_9BACT|nr:hypothetical protein [Tepiditoga spiralis]BBE31155.1 hypothetical protein OSSY52_12960 [Tepiditoga spiralis]
MQQPENKIILYFTIPITILILIVSSIGIWHQNLYFRETADWIAQCIGQDIANVFFMIPILLFSSIFIFKGNNLSKIIWLGAMLTNIYAFFIYCFGLHFNYLFLFYCAILGLSIYSVIYFVKIHLQENFKKWYIEKVPEKSVGIFLVIIASMFFLLWFSSDLPDSINNTPSIELQKLGLLVNVVHVLDYTFYLPLIFISGILIFRKKNLGYLLAPTMLVFAILTNINIISLTLVGYYRNIVQDLSLLFIISFITMICLVFFILMSKKLKSI